MAYPIKAFHRDDVVTDLGNTHRGLGLVLKSHLDDSDSESEEDDEEDPWRRRSKRQIPPNYHRVAFAGDNRVPFRTLPASRLELEDRSFLPGDIAKFPIGNGSKEQSGTVYAVRMLVDLGNNLTKKEILSIDTRELRYANTILEGDHVIYRDWLGVVRQTYDEITLLFPDSSVCVVREPLSCLERIHSDSPFATKRLYPGAAIQCTRGVLRRARWIKGSGTYMVKTKKVVQKMALVLDVCSHALRVSWCAHNPLKSPSTESATMTRKDSASPESPVTIDGTMSPAHDIAVQETPSSVIYDVENIRVLKSCYDNATYQIGDRVEFRNRTSEVSIPSLSSESTLSLASSASTDVSRITSTYTILRTITAVDILWQDGTRSVDVKATELIPCTNLDEQEFWPMDFVVGKVPAAQSSRSSSPKYDSTSLASASSASLVGSRIGIIRTVSSAERTCEVSWFSDDMKMSTSETSELSVYEVGSHAEWSFRLGHRVLVTSRPEQKDKSRLLVVDPDPTEWVGEVTDITELGMIVVRFPLTEREQQFLPTHLLLLEDLEDNIPKDSDDEDVDDDAETASDEVDFDSDGNSATGSQRFSASDEDALPDSESWVDDDIADFTPRVPPLEREGDALRAKADDESSSSDDDEDDDWTTASDSASEYGGDGVATGGGINGGAVQHQTEPCAHLASLTSPSERGGLSASSEHLALGKWYDRFAVMEGEPPKDHRFLHAAVDSHDMSYLRRVRAEHQMLATGLPDGILVRAFEARLDVLRVLIVGPPHTPYEYALFLFDMLIPATFPLDPPFLHYHSYTGGLGRLNPNLYEDGRVCLSLLGTWHGKESSETWTVGSSLLQVVTSVQGLVLGVENPYYNEAGYDRFVGNLEETRNATVYTERAFLLSARSVLHILNHPPEPFAEEARAFFFKPMENLERLVTRCKGVVVRTEAARSVAGKGGHGVGEQGRDGGDVGLMRTVSKGCLKLLKTLVVQLQAKIDAYREQEGERERGSASTV
ncbi:hypothetical protein M427DRAFT_66707 [Gonapodya prolifera JEL478]|uniref:UBC core domain-containing protein n=1 Tax=Gonapodya prolifera (strain JEL478) TaxID=1344416 RepID=A0A139ATX3_GONPJ|nr:hypothetical protein M427DRAFT_66707 [Gonapodya prolifera JEL478]|eukprot:KXS20157.1 hypothetical protein M427DRAFT_66707 [Gonapodya prolifera JEL478]